LSGLYGIKAIKGTGYSLLIKRSFPPLLSALLFYSFFFLSSPLSPFLDGVIIFEAFLTSEISLLYPEVICCHANLFFSDLNLK